MRRLVPVLLILAVFLPQGNAMAQGYDARGMAMGGVSLSQNSGRLYRVNPAYKAVPPRVAEHSISIPIPLGLIQFIQDFPELDPDSEDFSAIGIINFISNIPWAWEFKRPRDPKEGMEIWLGQDHLVIDLKDAQEIIPREGYTIGGMGHPFDLGFKIPLGTAGLVHFSLFRPFLSTEIDFGLNDELVGVLADADSIAPSTDYAASSDALMQAGVTSGVTWALPLWLDGNGGTNGQGGGFWVGAGFRHYFGGGYVRLDGDLVLHSGDPIFATAGADTFDAEFHADYYRAWPNDLATVGYGNALDLGAVFRRGRLELGAGVADIFADITWNNTQLDHSYLDPDFNEIITENVAEHFTTTTDIPVSWLLNVIWHGDRLVLAANAIDQPGGFSMHGGAEFWAIPWLALRGGASMDQRNRAQAGWGVGVKVGSFGIDLGFQTHNLGLTDERGVSMGLAVTLY